MAVVMQARIPVVIEHVPETDTWDFTVEELHIVGGGCSTHGEAREQALEAIALALDEPIEVPGVDYVSAALM